jgi:hypothetical protein
VGCIRHEPPHEFDRTLDGRRRFANENESTGCEKNQSGESDYHERSDEIGVFVFQLHLIRHSDRDQLPAGHELESHCVQAQRLVLGKIALDRDLTCRARLSCGLANPRIRLRRLDRIPVDIE